MRAKACQSLKVSDRTMPQSLRWHKTVASAGLTKRCRQKSLNAPHARVALRDRQVALRANWNETAHPRGMGGIEETSAIRLHPGRRYCRRRYGAPAPPAPSAPTSSSVANRPVYLFEDISRPSTVIPNTPDP